MNAATVTPLRNDDRREVYPPPSEGEAKLAAGLAFHYKVVSDLEVTRSELDGQRQTNKLLELEIESSRLRAEHAEERAAAMEQERDEARIEVASCRVVLSNFRAMLDRYEVEPAPRPARSRKAPVPVAPTQSDT